MRNLKRFLAMALSVLMVAGSFAAVSAKEFTDVEADTDYAAAISKLTDIGVIQGYSDDTYKPETELTRWHMALFLARLDSGRIEAEDTLRLWYETTNYTPFKDVEAGDYPVAAINYVYNYDMIVGTSETTFSPDAGIAYQDALTMVVRALGYGSEAMDAGYPWKYINKANELGLTDGVDAAVLYTDTLNRGEMAQVLYNALYAVNANGATYAEKYMGQTTVMITGAYGYKIAAVEPVRIANYVSVNVMNANGTINTDVTYFLPASEFEDVADPKALVGMTYRVNTSDNFVTIDLAEPCEYAEFDTDEFEGYVGANGAASNKLTIDGEDYKIVDSYSFLYNSQVTSSVGTSKDGSNEIMLFAYYAGTTDASEEFQYDANYNILDAKGEIVAYYVPAITGSYDAPYAAKLADGVYLPFVGGVDVTVDEETGEETYSFYDWKEEIKRVMNGNEYLTTTRTYAALDRSNFITVSDRFASIKAYDDDVDGLYERAFYNYKSFGYIAPVANTNPVQYTIDGVNYGSNVVSTVVDAEGKAVPFANNYVRWTYDAITGQVVIDKIYSFVDAGKVIGVNGNNVTTTIGNYNITGIANYPGAYTARVEGNLIYKLFGYNVSVITETDSTGAEKVLVVKKTSAANKTLIFDQIVSINTNGYVKAQVYDLFTGKKDIVDIATVYGYEYTEFKTLLKLFNYYNDLASGDVWSVTYDAITGLAHFNGLAAGANTLEADAELTFACATYIDPVSKKETEVELNTVKAAFGTIAAGKKTTGATNIIVRYSTVINGIENYQYAVQAGAANCSDIIEALAGTTYYVGYCKTSADNDTIDYLYINLADGDTAQEFGSVAGINSTKVVFVGADTGVTVSTDGVLGQVYNYTGLYCSDGTRVDTVVYNYRLEVGHFYALANDYIEYEVSVPAFDEVAPENWYSVKGTDAAKVFVIAANNSVSATKDVTYAYAWLGNFVMQAHLDAAQAAADKEAADKEAADKEAAEEAEKEAAAAALEAAWEALFVAIENEKNANAADYMTIALAALEAQEITDETVIAEAKIAMRNYIADAKYATAVEIVEYLPSTVAEFALAEGIKKDNSRLDYTKGSEEYNAQLNKALKFYELAVSADADVAEEEITIDKSASETVDKIVANRIDEIKTALAK